MGASLKDIHDSWAEAVDGAKVITTQLNSTVILNLLYLPPCHRHQGHGDAIMTELTTYCDRHNLTLLLQPDPTYGTPLHVLHYFYEKHGLVLGDDGAMHRDPLYRDDYLRNTAAAH